jgi:hypothetical protein
MIAEKKTNTNIGVGVGFVLQIIGRLLANQGDSMVALGILITLAGLALFIWGCWNYAEGKGYSGALGLLGLLSCIGLIVLILLPDKRPSG